MVPSVEAERVFPLDFVPFAAWADRLGGEATREDDCALIITSDRPLGGEFNRCFLKPPATENTIERCAERFQNANKHPSFTISAYSEGDYLGQRLTERGYAPEASMAVLRRIPERTEPDLPGSATLQTVSLNTLSDFARLNQQALPGIFGLLEPADVARVHKPLLDEDSWSLTLAWVNDHPASFSLFYDDDQTGYYLGAGTQQQLQDRGLHTALIRTRLNKAHEKGLATVYAWAQAGSTSQRNLERCGFELIDFYQHWG